jgi:hypothetical protein
VLSHPIQIHNPKNIRQGTQIIFIIMRYWHIQLPHFIACQQRQRLSKIIILTVCFQKYFGHGSIYLLDSSYQADSSAVQAFHRMRIGNRKLETYEMQRVALQCSLFHVRRGHRCWTGKENKRMSDVASMNAVGYFAGSQIRMRYCRLPHTECNWVRAEVGN